MAQPTQTEVHVDAILTGISVAYMQSASNFIASRVFPVVGVEKQTDKYYTYDKNDWFRDEAQQRADATESAGSGYGLSTASYSCDVFAFHKDIGYQTRANADNPLNLDRDAVAFVTQMMLQKQERKWVADYFTTSVWATDVVGGSNFTVWSNYSTSDPIEDVETAKETILSTTGYEPNTMVIGYQVFRKLKHHPDVVDRIKYTSAENITAAMLARMFELDNLYVAKAVKATNNEGETAAYAFTHGKHAWIGYVAPNPSLMTPSAGYTFQWNGVSQGLGENVGISRWWMQNIKADRVEGEIAFDNKVVATDMGYFFSGAVA